MGNIHDARMSDWCCAPVVGRKSLDEFAPTEFNEAGVDKSLDEFAPTEIDEAGVDHDDELENFIDVTIADELHDNGKGEQPGFAPALQQSSRTESQISLKSFTHQEPDLVRKLKTAFHCTRNRASRNFGPNCRYEVLASLGKGSWGQVFLSTLVKSADGENIFCSRDHIHAIKTISKACLSDDDGILSQVLAERDALALIGSHPFILELHHAFQTPQYVAFVTSFCGGGELRRYLGLMGTFCEEIAKFYTMELVFAIEHLHSLHIIHRDIKPENILLDDRGHLKLADLGVCKFPVVAAAQGAATFCGTAEYMAPEIVTSSGHGTGVDWWQLGMVVVEMLVGKPCWGSRPEVSPNELMHRIRHWRPPLGRHKLPPSACNFAEALLAKDPSQRLGSWGSCRAHTWFKDTAWPEEGVEGAWALLHRPAPLTPCFRDNKEPPIAPGAPAASPAAEASAFYRSIWQLPGQGVLHHVDPRSGPGALRYRDSFLLDGFEFPKRVGTSNGYHTPSAEDGDMDDSLRGRESWNTDDTEALSDDDDFVEREERLVTCYTSEFSDDEEEQSEKEGLFAASRPSSPLHYLCMTSMTSNQGEERVFADESQPSSPLPQNSVRPNHHPFRKGSIDC